MPSDTIRLYQSNSSPNSRRVRIFLAEKGLSIPLVAVDLGKASSIPSPTVRSTAAGRAYPGAGRRHRHWRGAGDLPVH